MSKLDLTKPVRCVNRRGDFLKVQIVYVTDQLIVGLAEGCSAAATWTVDNLWCVSSHNFGPLENYETPFKVKKVVYLHESHDPHSFYVSMAKKSIYSSIEAVASVEVEFTVGEFAE